MIKWKLVGLVLCHWFMGTITDNSVVRGYCRRTVTTVTKNV